MSKLPRNQATKARKQSPKVIFEKTGKNMTSKAGLIPVIKFLDKLGFHGLFKKTVDHQRKPNSLYNLDDGVFMVIVGIIGGAFSLSKCAQLWSGCEVIQRIAGWISVPDETTLGRIFKSLKDRHVSQMETFVHSIRKRVWEKASIIQISDLWIDVDSSVKTVYGNQEGAEKGFNSHKRGALSYHPLLAFATHTKEILQGWLRSGNAYTSNGVLEFMKQLLAQLDGNQRIIFRGDSGFFVGELMDHLDSLGHGYLIKVKMKNLVNLLVQQVWEPIPGKPGWESCQFWHCASSWNVGRMLVAVRREKSREASLLSAIVDKVDYDFFCYATTENLTPWETHKKYGQRATSETWIEEAKNQSGLAHMKTGEFLANAGLFQSAILAYNTLRWMALMSNNKELQQWEPMTIRIHLICVAGKLKTGSNQNKVVLPKHHLYSTAWDDWLKLAA